VYGLTETTAICTIDVKDAVTPGRVGQAVAGIEMKVGERDEILVRGPNLFAGYWEAPELTARAFVDGWLRTGDFGDVDAAGNWRIHGRLDEVIVLASGHKVVPSRLEQPIRLHLPGAEQVVVAADADGQIAAVVVGKVDPAAVEQALGTVNRGLASYEAVRFYRIHNGPFTIDNGFLTANGKIRRDRVATWLRAGAASSL
jgi:long-chain acyl-CoA synthetase